MELRLKINVKKFVNEKDVRYALSTLIYDKAETDNTKGTWYKVIPTNLFKKNVEDAKIKLNRPFILTIDENYLGYDIEEKKLFIRGGKPCKIEFIESDKKESNDNKIPKFSDVFKTSID